MSVAERSREMSRAPFRTLAEEGECPLNDEYLRRVIRYAKRPLSVEKRAISMIYADGYMRNLDRDGQRTVEARVRELLNE